MTTNEERQPGRRRRWRGRRRRWRWITLLALMAALAIVAGLPWLAALAPVQRRLAAEASKRLAPSSVSFEAIRLSWFRPTEIDDLVLRGPTGQAIVSAPNVVFQWNFGEILFSHPRAATIAIHRPDLDITRRADGTIDLYEALKPVITERPKRKLAITIDHGQLRYRDPAFPEPVVADQADIEVDLSIESQPISWTIQLARAREHAEPGRLEIKGIYSRANVDSAGNHDLKLSLNGTRWHWTLAHEALTSRGDFSGSIDLRREAGRLFTTADTVLSEIVVAGAPLVAPDTIRLATNRAVWDIEGSDGAWAVRRLELTTPLGSLKGAASLPTGPGRGASLDGTLDLAALAAALPATLHLRDGLVVRQGSARLHADLTGMPNAATQLGVVTGEVSDLVASHGAKTLVMSDTARFDARVQLGRSSATLERLEVKTPYLSLTGQGDVERGIDVAGALDLAGFRRRFQDWVDLGTFDLAGQVNLVGRYQREKDRYKATATATIRDLKATNLPVARTIDREQLTIGVEAGGTAAAAGWPRDWRRLALRVADGQTDLALTATAPADHAPIDLDGHAETDWEYGGRKQRLEGNLKARWDRDGWVADPIQLAVIPVTKWGPGIGGGPPVRWAGRARYTERADELYIESTATGPGGQAPAAEPPAGRQTARLKGLKHLGTSQLELDATADIEPICKWLRPDDAPWTGTLAVVARAQADRGPWNLGARVDLRDLVQLDPQPAADPAGDDVSFAVNGTYDQPSDRLLLSEISIRAPFLKVDGAGSIAPVTGNRVADLNGSIVPDWARLNQWLSSKIEPRAQIKGRASNWRLAGPIPGLTRGQWPGSIDGEIGLAVDSVDIFGMKMGAAALVVRARNGQLGIDPVETSLNGGVLHLEPALARDKDGGIWLRMDESSRLDGAVVNDEVSHRVLSFVAPILDGATRVDGRISVVMSQASVPIMAAPAANANIEGNVLFDQVRFLPGPLAEELLSVFKLDQKPLMVLRDPISVRIADRTIRQKGLKFPVGKVASIGLDGSVDFDAKLDLLARFAMVPPRDNVPILTPILQSAHFELPIGGTLEKPKINGAALKERMKHYGADLLDNSLQLGVDSLERLLRGVTVPPFRGLGPRARRRAAEPPPAPAPPPLAPAPEPPAPTTGDSSPPPVPPSARDERRAQRLAKKAERRARRAITDQTPDR